MLLHTKHPAREEAYFDSLKKEYIYYDSEKIFVELMKKCSLT